MSLALMLAFQVSAQPAAPPPPPAAIAFDLARYRPAGSGAGMPAPVCVRDGATEILVCGRRPRGGAGAYPLDEMAQLFERGPLVAETRLFGNATGRFYVEGVELAPGLVSNRVMVGIRFPF